MDVPARESADIDRLRALIRGERDAQQRDPSGRDPEDRAELRTNLGEIAMRGESAAWKDWARLQLVKLDGGR
jgi:hypothetical protein